jgi:hypothetical protein
MRNRVSVSTSISVGIIIFAVIVASVATVVTLNLDANTTTPSKTSSASTTVTSISHSSHVGSSAQTSLPSSTSSSTTAVTTQSSSYSSTASASSTSSSSTPTTTPITTTSTTSPSAFAYAIMFQCVSECNQTLGGGAQFVCNNTWSMAWIVQMTSYNNNANASFAYDLFPNVPAGWPYPTITVYGNQPLGVYSSEPYLNVDYAMSVVGLWFQAGKYGCNAPQFPITIGVSLYQVPLNDTTTFWAFGYNPNMISLTQTIQPLRTSYFSIPTDNTNATCGFSVPSSTNETCS